LNDSPSIIDAGIASGKPDFHFPGRRVLATICALAGFYFKITLSRAQKPPS